MEEEPQSLRAEQIGWEAVVVVGQTPHLAEEEGPQSRRREVEENFLQVEEEVGSS